MKNLENLGLTKRLNNFQITEVIFATCHNPYLPSNY
jgi:hypothetical protein